jgi:hypothetical protein
MSQLVSVAGAAAEGSFGNTACSMHKATASAEGASSPKWNPSTLRVATSIASDNQGRPMECRNTESTIMTSASVWSI